MAKKLNLNIIPNLKKTNKKKMYNNLSLIGILLGFFLFCYALYYGIYDYNKMNQSVTTKASVENVDFNGDSYIVKIKYDVMNKTYENTITKKAESITINDFIDIRYNINNPYEIITRDHFIEICIASLFSLVFISTSAIYLIITKRDEKRIQNLITNGIVIYADIEGIFVNNNAKRKRGKLPYHIKAKYLNPQDYKEYTYVSKDYYEDLLGLTHEKTISKVPVYINSSNTDDYYMDLKYILPEEPDAK